MYLKYIYTGTNNNDTGAYLSRSIIVLYKYTHIVVEDFVHMASVLALLHWYICECSIRVIE